MLIELPAELIAMDSCKWWPKPHDVTINTQHVVTLEAVSEQKPEETRLELSNKRTLVILKSPGDTQVLLNTLELQGTMVAEMQARQCLAQSLQNAANQDAAPKLALP